MQPFQASEHQHIRFNPLTKDWILVSPHRTKRPWKGQIEKRSDEEIPEFDAANPLCPGTTRPNGIKNENYTSTYVFTNDFPALLDDVSSPPKSDSPFFQARKAAGTCKVICFHPKSNITLPLMEIDSIVRVIETWQSESRLLNQKYTWTQIFENKGDIMGCSNPHPHCQIWSSNYLPNEPVKENQSQREYYEKNGRQFLLDYLDEELKARERIVVENEFWVVLVPFWATWPYETLLLPRKSYQRIEDLDEPAIEALARIMKTLLIKYDNLFEISFPYTMGWHGAPGGDYLNQDTSYWTLHAHYYPPLLRSASIKKFMVGYEMMAQPQRDSTPEQVANTLRELPEVHYKHRK